MKTGILLIGAYAIGWFLTFGYLYNNIDCRPPAERFTGCTADIGLPSGLGATFWPIYWPAHISIVAMPWSKGK